MLEKNFLDNICPHSKIMSRTIESENFCMNIIHIKKSWMYRSFSYAGLVVRLLLRFQGEINWKSEALIREPFKCLKTFLKLACGRNLRPHTTTNIWRSLKDWKFNAIIFQNTSIYHIYATLFLGHFLHSPKHNSFKSFHLLF